MAIVINDKAVVAAFNNLSDDQREKFFPGGIAQAKKVIGSLGYLLGSAPSFDQILELYITAAVRVMMGFENNRIAVTVEMRFSDIVPENIAITVTKCIERLYLNFAVIEKTNSPKIQAFDAQNEVAFKRNEKHANNATQYPGFGVNPSNPIFAHATHGSYSYLNCLYTSALVPLTWNRVKSMIIDSSPDPLDVYELLLPNGDIYQTVYINMYARKASIFCPAGLHGDELKNLPQTADIQSQKKRMESEDPSEKNAYLAPLQQYKEGPKETETSAKSGSNSHRKIDVLSIVSAAISVLGTIVYGQMFKHEFWAPVFVFLAIVSVVLPVFAKVHRIWNHNSGKLLEIIAIVVGGFNVYSIVFALTKAPLFIGYLGWVFCAIAYKTVKKEEPIDSHSDSAEPKAETVLPLVPAQQDEAIEPKPQCDETPAASVESNHVCAALMRHSLTAEFAEQTTDEFPVFDSYDDFDARHGKYKTAREATNALIDERIAKYGRIGDAGKNNARETSIPRQMKPGTKVSKAAETITASGMDSFSIVIDKNSMSPVLRRAFIFLEDGNWAKADEYFERELDQQPENAFAYFGKVLCSYKVNTPNSIPILEDLTHNTDFAHALSFSKDSFHEELQALSSRMYESAEPTPKVIETKPVVTHISAPEASTMTSVNEDVPIPVDTSKVSFLRKAIKKYGKTKVIAVLLVAALVFLYSSSCGIAYACAYYEHFRAADNLLLIPSPSKKLNTYIQAGLAYEHEEYTEAIDLFRSTYPFMRAGAMTNKSLYCSAVQDAENGRYAWAADALESLVQMSYSNDTVSQQDILFLQAQCLSHNNEKLARAIEICNDLIKQGFSKAEELVYELHYKLAKHYAGTGNPIAAYDEMVLAGNFQDAIVQADRLKHTIYSYGQNAYRAGKLNDAEAYFSVDALSSYKDTKDYLFLISMGKNPNQLSSTQNYSKIVSLIGFENSAAILSSNFTALMRFLDGTWKDSSGKTRLGFKDGKWVRNNFKRVMTGSNYYYTSPFSFYSTNDYGFTIHVYKDTIFNQRTDLTISIINRDTLRVICAKDNKSYLVRRD